ncbi:MAG TPA: DUF5658 family protein [Candidatus Polarisedimenticolia bacterium]|nr:DUF5658 family protein [Candidatus Polarisedimenticolia bacterium]
MRQPTRPSRRNRPAAAASLVLILTLEAASAALGAGDPPARPPSQPARPEPAAAASTHAAPPEPAPSAQPPSPLPIPKVADARYWSLAGGVYATGVADWMTTRWFREQGIEEANPIMEPVVDNGAALAAVKLGAGSLVNYASYSLKKGKRRWWAVPQIAWITLNLAVSVHNYNQLEEER